MSNEEIIWTGRPSQIINFKVFVLCGLFCWLVVPVFIGLWHWLQVRCIEYSLTDERLQMRSGVLNKTTATLELYRVKDLTVSEPLFLRLFSKANIHLDTSDKSHPKLTLQAISDATELSAGLRQLVEASRRGKVREVDMA